MFKFHPMNCQKYTSNFFKRLLFVLIKPDSLVWKIVFFKMFQAMLEKKNFYGEAVFWAEVKSEGCTFKCFLQSYKRSCSG